MAIDPSISGGSAIDRWNELHQTLSAQERRMIIYSLMEVPQSERVPLPEAATAPGTSCDAEQMRIRLEHDHLPQMATAGYIRWERDPFCVQRGPRFKEAEAMFETIHDSIDQFPQSLITGCKIYEEMCRDGNR